MAASRPTNKLRHAACFGVFAGLCFATMGALVKLTTGHISTEMAVFLRNSFGLLILSPWLLRIGIQGLRSQRPGGHLLRASFGLAAMYCFFYTFRHLPLAQAMLLNFTAPLYLPLIAAWWLKEKPGPWAYPAAMIGLLGVAIVLRPGSGNSLVSFAGFIGVLSGLLAAFAMASVRRLSSTEPATRIVFYFTFLGALLSGFPQLALWETPSPNMLLVMFGAGICATLGQLSLTRAYTLGTAAQVGPLTYTTVLFASVWGWLLWNEQLDKFFIGGSLLIVFGSWLAMREHPQAAEVPEAPLPPELIQEDLAYGRD